MARRGRFQESLNRALAGGPIYKKSGVRPALGNLKVTSSSRGTGGGPIAGTAAVTFQSPGMPQSIDQDALAYEGLAYSQNVFVMRCIQTIATTISGLPFMAGLDPFDPGDYDPTAPLSQLLGPATPQAPGGPNPTASARMLWDWSIKQYVTYGRFAWETQLAKVPGRGRKLNDAIVGLWPLPAPYITPVPTDGGLSLFSGFKYQTPTREKDLKPDECFYAWKPSHDDWRQAESVLDAARLPVNISVGLDKYMAMLLQNDMVATTMVVTPPFAEPSGRRAFRQQFRARYTGVDQAGTTMFGEAHRRQGDTTNNPLVQVERIAQTAVESSAIAISQQAKIDITIALGVPMSLIGNASQRTYANADSEYKNFWTITILPMISDLQDYVNTFLSPRIGMEVGWFDLSKVAALKPPALFAPPMIGDAINFGVATADQVANVLGIPAANATSDADTDTVDVGVESATSTSLGGRSDMRTLYGVTKDQMLSAAAKFDRRKLNTHNLTEDFVLQRYIEREVVRIRTPKKDTGPLPTPEAALVLRHVTEVKERRAYERRLVAAAALRERTEAVAAEARAEIERMRGRGDEFGAEELEEFIGETGDFRQLTNETVPLTAWDGDPDTFDAWVDANSGALEAMADG